MHSNKLSIFRHVHLGDRLLFPDPTRTLKWSHWFLPVKFNKPMLLLISVDTSVVFDSVEYTIFKILPLLVIDRTALLFLLCDCSSFPSAESSSLSPYLHGFTLCSVLDLNSQLSCLRFSCAVLLVYSVMPSSLISVTSLLFRALTIWFSYFIPLSWSSYHFYGVIIG